MDQTGPWQYAVQILLPGPIEERLRHWVEKTPGATWPAWGGHISLVNLFVPQREIHVIEQEIRDVCAAFSPFTLCLDQAVVETHWRRPQYRTVLLKACDKSTEGYRALMRLRDALVAALTPLTWDAHPEVSQRPFDPHLTLTWGVSEADASRLAEAAQADHLEAEFMVEEIWLISFFPQAGEQEELLAHDYRAFRLGPLLSQEIAGTGSR